MNRICKIVITILIFMDLASCTQATKMNQQEPYKTAIGKNFFLQKDLYIYQFNDPGSSLCIGDANNMANYSIGIPKVIDEKYIGTKGQYITIKGVVKKGDVMTIKNIIKKQTFEDLNFIYNVVFGKNSYSNQALDASDIINLKNPPFTTTWSDPPIFDAKYALPLASDGVWWK